MIRSQENDDDQEKITKRQNRWQGLVLKIL